MQAPTKKWKAAASNFVGVSQNPRGGTWMANITDRGQDYYLGSYDEEKDAARAFDHAASQLRGVDASGSRRQRSQRGPLLGRWRQFALNFPNETVPADIVAKVEAKIAAAQVKIAAAQGKSKSKRKRSSTGNREHGGKGGQGRGRGGGRGGGVS